LLQNREISDIRIDYFISEWWHIKGYRPILNLEILNLAPRARRARAPRARAGWCRMSGSKDLGARRAMKKSWCGAAARG
jgi:hypothetical protein